MVEISDMRNQTKENGNICQIPRLLDRDHVLVKICGCGEHSLTTVSLTTVECRKLRDQLDHAIRLLEYNQELRKVPNTVHCKLCNVATKETKTIGRDGVLWSLPEGWGWVTRYDNVLDQPGVFCACPEHKGIE